MLCYFRLTDLSNIKDIMEISKMMYWISGKEVSIFMR